MDKPKHSYSPDRKYLDVNGKRVPILTHDELVKWFKHHFSILQRRRSPKTGWLTERLMVQPGFLKKIASKQARINIKHQRRFSIVLHQVGNTEEKVKVPYLQRGRGLDPYKGEVAAVIASMSWPETKEFGINQQNVIMCKDGLIPNFRRSTLKRLWVELISKDIPWESEK